MLPRMAEALLLFQQPALNRKGKIKFEGKRNVFGAVPYFKRASLLPVLKQSLCSQGWDISLGQAGAETLQFAASAWRMVLLLHTEE